MNSLTSHHEPHHLTPVLGFGFRQNRPFPRQSYGVHTNAFAEIANAFAEITNEFAEITNAFAEVANAFAEITNAFSEVANAFSEVANAFSEVANEFAEIVILQIFGDEIFPTCVYTVALARGRD